MKHIYKYIVVVLTTIVLVSCNLDRYPNTSLPADDIKGNPEATFGILMNGAYAQLKGWSDEIHRIGEYPSDNISIRSTSTDSFFPFISYRHRPNNGRLMNVWRNSYRAISQASEIINVSKTLDIDTPQFLHQVGEAYYIRGMSYFYLTRIFGRPYYQVTNDASQVRNLGVPILLNGIPANLSELETPNRSTVIQCYNQAISDLKEAEKLMSINKTAIYATKEAAQAMLSRVYLYMSGTYENPNAEYAEQSRQYADLVIKSERYALLSTNNFRIYNQYTPDDRAQTETIFGIKRVSSEFSGGYGSTTGSMYANIDGVGWGEMYASAKYLELLNKPGFRIDARWGFIRPQYEEESDGQGGTRQIPAFRYVEELYREGVQTGYLYVQDRVNTRPDGSFYVSKALPPTTAVPNPPLIDYPLVPVDAVNNKYSLTFNGRNYIGEKDFQMKLNNTHPMFYVYKTSQQGGIAHLHSPTVSRLAEMYLNQAEALIKLGRVNEALAPLNVVRERSLPGLGYTSAEFTTATAKQLVNDERQLEFGFEAHRAYDVFRNGETMVRRYPGAHPSLEEHPATSNAVVHPIPQEEIDAYPEGGLTPNPI